MGEYPSLVATDLDGTIIRGDGTISARTVAAFARVEAAGARFVLVTGRPPRWMAAIAATFGHRGTAICANGALAYDMHTGEIEARHLIPPPVLAAAATALRAAVPGIGIAVEYPDGHAADPVYQSVNWDVNLSLPRLDDAALFARPASKLLGRHFGYTCDDLLTHGASRRSTAWSASPIPTPRGSSRPPRSASPRRASSPRSPRCTGSSRESVIAFGDMPNDLPLLAWAGTSCAVANAHPAVLAAATHVIGSNDEDGVADVPRSAVRLTGCRCA